MSLDLGLFILALAGTAIAAGGVGAILGLGGGILLIPVLTMFFGVSLKYAMGASIVSVIATSSGAAAHHLRSRLSNMRIGLFLVLASTTGAITGAHLAGVVPARWLEAILGLALAYSAVATLRQIGVELPETVPHDRWAVRLGHEGTYRDARLGVEVRYRATRVVWGFLAMYVAGILSGLLGVGSGAFKVLTLDYLMQVPAHRPAIQFHLAGDLTPRPAPPMQGLYRLLNMHFELIHPPQYPQIGNLPRRPFQPSKWLGLKC